MIVAVSRIPLPKTERYLYWVRVAHENNPNILLLGEAFGLFVLFDYPNFNSKK